MDTVAKSPLSYTLRTFTNMETNQPYRRAVPIATGVETLNSLCAAVVEDGTYGAAKLTLLRNHVMAILEKARSAIKSGKTVILDDYLRLKGTFVNDIDPVTGKPGKDTVYRVRATSLRKLQFPVSDFELTNVESDGSLPAITSVLNIGLTAKKDVLIRGKDIILAGRNLYFDAAQGDTLMVSFLEDGERQSISLSPSEIAPAMIRVPWPAALAEVESGTEVSFTLSTRRGKENGVFTPISRKATLVTA